MNIKSAKKELKNTISIYIETLPSGLPLIPYEKQRPIFLLGAPGIGKTAIVHEVAREMSLPLVSYSMTHLTRQSAVGLPYIMEQEYASLCTREPCAFAEAQNEKSAMPIETEKTRVTRYTMGEVIAAVYDAMEKSGQKKGILFLDEINCISETLLPTVLQFLQYKTFANYPLPEGWVIVTAGNPKEYNRSAREFDVATLDRLKVLSVTEDSASFIKYARERKLHGAVLSFLEINPPYSYSLKKTAEGYAYATPRGWEDLSLFLKAYELKGYEVGVELVLEYISDSEIAGRFAVYYALYQKMQASYPFGDILSESYDDTVKEKAQNAPFDERLSMLEYLHELLIQDMEPLVDNMVDINPKSDTAENQESDLIDMRAENARKRLEASFHFIEDVWGEDQELVYHITLLTADSISARFIAGYGSPAYSRLSHLIRPTETRDELKRILKQSPI